MNAQGHPAVRFVAYRILFNIIEAIYEFPIHSGDTVDCVKRFQHGGTHIERSYYHRDMIFDMGLTKSQIGCSKV